ncbi:hypothetical protein SUGI_1146300 [Cryptomeria japonica]|nr:hypothetical protein SUGI_1146300 [Cryptomeria japonica]
MAEFDSNPSWRLSSVPINGINYVAWSRAVTLSLGGKKKFGFVNGDKKCPQNTESGYDDWISNDQLVRSWLLNSMETHIAEIFTFSNSAKELWDSIAELYGNQNNAARIFELTLEIAAAQQGEKTFSEHLGKLKKLWDELNLYRPHTTDAKTLLKRAEEDKIFSLLSSLKPEYEYIRSNLLMDATLPTLVGVCDTIQREETRRKTMSSESKTSTEKIESNVLLAEKDDKRKPHFFNKNMNVSRYKKIGHTKDRCWELHPHLKSEYKGRKDHAVVADTPFSINQLGHLLQQLSKTISSGNSPSTSTHVSGKLHAYLTSHSKINSSIIDSGATDHMANSPSSVINFILKTDKHDISVANGTTVPALRSGKISLFSHSASSDALVVPSFPVQLMSVGKITNSLNCDVIFSPKSVISQDRKSKKTISKGTYSHELYFLNSLNKACHASGVIESHTLHKRLGHPSNRILSRLCPSTSVDFDVCDVCQFSKQMRLPFLNSSSMSTELFELVHSDLWGPAPTDSYDGY